MSHQNKRTGKENDSESRRQGAEHKREEGTDRDGGGSLPEPRSRMFLKAHMPKFCSPGQGYWEMVEALRGRA